MLVNKPWGKGMSIFISVSIPISICLYLYFINYERVVSIELFSSTETHVSTHTQWGERERETRRRLSTQELFYICFRQLQGGKEPWAPSNLLEFQVCSQLGFPSGIFCGCHSRPEFHILRFPGDHRPVDILLSLWVLTTTEADFWRLPFLLRV